MVESTCKTRSTSKAAGCINFKQRKLEEDCIMVEKSQREFMGDTRLGYTSK